MLHAVRIQVFLQSIIQPGSRDGIGADIPSHQVMCQMVKAHEKRCAGYTGLGSKRGVRSRRRGRRRGVRNVLGIFASVVWVASLIGWCWIFVLFPGSLCQFQAARIYATDFSVADSSCLIGASMILPKVMGKDYCSLKLQKQQPHTLNKSKSCKYND